MTVRAAGAGQRPLTYSGGELDRSGALRSDASWLAGLAARPDATVLPFWRDSCLVAAGRPVTLAGPAAARVLAAAGQTAFLGRDGEAGVFAADLTALTEAEAVELAGAEGVRDVRALVGELSGAQAATLGHARGILFWNRHQPFCGTCGAGTESRDGGHLRVCLGPDCGRLLFARIEPAVIVLVEGAGPPDRCLLAHHRGSAEDSWSTLAGFVEVGESLEDAVRREVLEESGVEVGEVTYQASQAWPFPAGLMLGFRARAVREDIRPDGVEVERARWFTRDELVAGEASGRRLGRPDSIDRFLLRSWLEES